MINTRAELKLEFIAMATTYEVRVICDPSFRARVHAVFHEQARRLIELEESLSEFDPKSPVHRLNHAPPSEWIDCTADLVRLLEISRTLSLRTFFAFHPLAKSKIPDPSSSWDQLQWRSTLSGGGQVRRLCQELHLSLGAIGKGYAVDALATLLLREGFENFLISAGGSSIRCQGTNLDGQPWILGWRWFKSLREDGASTDLGSRLPRSGREPLCLGISGLQEQGQHILDVRNEGRASRSLSALVCSRTATEADALSTALFVQGWETAVRWRVQEQACAWISSEHIPHWDSGFGKRFKIPWEATSDRHKKDSGTRVASLALLTLGSGTLARADTPSTDSPSETVVDLGSGDAAKASPYAPIRSEGWIVLPALSLLVLALHLFGARKKDAEMHEARPFNRGGTDSPMISTPEEKP